MRPTPSRVRRTASLGILLSAAALVTAALSILTSDVIVQMDAGASHDFNIQVAAREVPVEWFAGTASRAVEWVPSTDGWSEGNPSPVVVGSPDAARQTRVYSVAVRNASPELSSVLCLSLGASENEVEFEKLRLTLIGADGQLVDALGADRPRICSDREVEAGGVEGFALRIAGGDPAAAETIVRLRVDGVQR